MSVFPFSCELYIAGRLQSKTTGDGILPHEDIEKLLNRDEKTFTDIIDTYSQLLWVIAGGYLSKSSGCSEEDVEECVSDVFIELWNNPGKFDPARGSLKSYLCSLTKYKAISAFRKKMRGKTVNLEDYRDIPDEKSEDYLDRPDHGEMYEALRALPEPTREILIRRYFYEETPAVISDKLAIPKKEIENRLYRGKQALSALLHSYREVE